VFAALALIIAGALLLGSGVLSRGGSTASSVPGASGAAAAGGSTGGGAAAPSLPTADVTLTAQNIAFVQTSLQAPAGKAFTIAFDNLDSAPHNLQISDASGASVFKGDIVSGPAVKVYTVPALPAGQYAFVCLVHPSMTGTLTVK
jgi:plastocyanin